jgi:hypothetical protein
MQYMIPSAILISLLSLGACTAPMGQRNNMGSNGYNNSTNATGNTEPRTGTTDTGSNGSTGNPAGKGNVGAGMSTVNGETPAK